jgi:8-oxo-dGTP pyrophosphatase MutT (NUDIX family)
MNQSPSDPLEQPSLHASGFLVFRRHPTGWKFLLLRHADRWDLPKGLVEPAETPLAAAFRELQEETGIPATAVRVVPDFQFTHRYQIPGPQGQPVVKQLTIFLAVIEAEPTLVLTEHLGFQWFDWAPPQRIEPQNVDQVLAAVQQYGWD